MTTYEEWLAWKLLWNPWAAPPTEKALKKYESNLRGLYEEAKKKGLSPFGRFAADVPEHS